MQPIIKWPGGKSRELTHIKTRIPQKFDRYVEPFFGGGAVFFALEPPVALVNDACTDLIQFYRFVKGELPREHFRQELYRYVAGWEQLSGFVDVVQGDLAKLFAEYRNNTVSESEITASVSELVNQKTTQFDVFSSSTFAVDCRKLREKIVSSTCDKFRRMKTIERQKQRLSPGDLYKNIETAVRSGFYLHFRDVMNGAKAGRYDIDEAKRIANYYFIREFCYGAMFRFNARGEFNIPYGGIAYNRKDFRRKVDALFADKTRELLSRTVIENLDFAHFLQKYSLRSSDFVFLDPPYDTEFSDYEQNTFSLEDQQRLADCLLSLKAKFLLIIKNTDFILNLYSGKRHIKISSFAKTYSYNVRGRNNRKAEHLLIYNY
ncbi:MAG: DNA adenine methylase [Thermoanaerobacteraceae bacterium]|nr:DNA adenine methylase [Thermoanaerobacteraceae bacterium]